MPVGSAVISIVLEVAAGVMLLNATLVCFVFTRRVYRRLYFHLKDEARQRLAGTVRAAVQNPTSERIAPLQRYTYPATRDAIQELLLDAITPQSHGCVTQIMLGLGYVGRWQRTAFRLSHPSGLMTRLADAARCARILAVPRAAAIGHLGRLRPDIALPILVAALSDPSPLVLSVAADALAATGTEGAVKPLVDLLQRSIVRLNALPERAAKTALVALGRGTDTLLHAYSNADDQRFKSALFDVIREQLAHTPTECANNISSAVIATACVDLDPEIRSRAARILPLVDSDVAVSQLAFLLKDPNPFVRLHAVRASAGLDVAFVTSHVVERLCDADWRVREAASLALFQVGDEGISAIRARLLTTADRFTAEQIMERVQLHGLLAASVSRLHMPEGRLDLLLCRKAVALRMDSVLIARLEADTPEPLLLPLLEVTQGSAHPCYRGQLQGLAAHSSIAVRNRVLALLQEPAHQAVGAA
jgi:hypothetical protein